MWRKVRISILVLILLTVAQRAWLEARILDWRDNLYVAVYPINADGSSAAAAYISHLSSGQFEPVDEYFSREAQRFGLRVQKPFQLLLGPAVSSQPPVPPNAGSVLQVVWWSLKFRWWAWRNSPVVQMPADIRLYLMYHDPEKTKALAHSTALNKGRIGLVNVFAANAYEKTNEIIVAHELLHTVGATDKYDLTTNLPHFPMGYAEPDKSPLYPQDLAELMAGRVPISSSEAEMPERLEQTLLGKATAVEIRWISQP